MKSERSFLTLFTQGLLNFMDGNLSTAKTTQTLYLHDMYAEELLFVCLCPQQPFLS